MSNETNTVAKNQNKSSIVILVVVIAVIAGVLGFGLYQNYSKTNTNTPNEIITTQITTIQEQATQEEATQEEVTQEYITTHQTTIEATSEEPTEPPSTEPENISLKIYNTYLNIIRSNDTTLYHIYDINHDGVKELILGLGESTIEAHYDVYSYDESKGGAYYTGTIKGNRVFYESYEGNLKSFWARQGSYCFFDITFKNGRTEEVTLINDYTTGEYPPIDGTELYFAQPADFLYLKTEILN